MSLTYSSLRPYAGLSFPDYNREMPEYGVPETKHTRLPQIISLLARFVRKQVGKALSTTTVLTTLCHEAAEKGL